MPLLSIAERRAARRKLFGIRGGVAWTPRELNPLVWFNEDGSGITEDGSHNLTGLVDASGNARHVTSISSTAPTVTTLGGRKAVVFAAGSTTYALSSFTALPEAAETSGTLWCLFKTGSLGAASSRHTLLSLGDSTAATRYGQLQIGQGSALYPHWTTVSASTQHRSEYQSALADSTLYSLIVELDTDANTCRIWLNESVVTDTVGTGSEGTFISDFPSGGIDRFGFGANVKNTSPNQPASVTICGGGWAHGVQSAANVENLLGYLEAFRTLRSAA